MIPDPNVLLPRIQVVLTAAWAVTVLPAQQFVTLPRQVLPAFPAATSYTSGVLLVDVDGDGDRDLIACNGGVSGVTRLLRNDGGGAFTDVTGTRMPADLDLSAAVAAGDVDGDGDADLAFANGDGGPRFSAQDDLYLNDGTGGFTRVTVSLLPPANVDSLAVELADLDEDGDLDLVFASPAGSRLWLNDGSGRFADATAARWPQPETGRALAVADVDEDGDLDVVLGRSGMNALRLNLHRHLHAPAPAAIGAGYGLVVSSQPGYAPAAAATLPFLAVAELRTPVPPLGVFGLDPAATAVLPLQPLPAPAGQAFLQLQIPADPVLVGLPVVGQALLTGPGAPRLTNVSRDTVRP